MSESPNPGAVRRRISALSDLSAAGVSLCNAARALVTATAADPDIQAKNALATARSAIDRALAQLDTGGLWWPPPDLPPAAREFLDRGRPERESPRAVSPVEYAATDNDPETGGRVVFVDRVGDVCTRCAGQGFKRVDVIKGGRAPEWETCRRCDGSGKVGPASPPWPHQPRELGEGPDLSDAEVRRLFADDTEEGAA